MPPFLVHRAVAAALEEDLGQAGDITTDPIIPADATAEAEIVARKAGVIAGQDLAAASFKALDPDAEFVADVADGGKVGAATRIAHVRGKARALLTAERTALNFLGHLSGIATLTAAYVAAVEGTKARIACTRKTTPGLRAFEKYAVRAGGGVNHRFGLYDAVLVKDNHIAAAGGIAQALERLRARSGHLVKVEVEVDTLRSARRGAALPHRCGAARQYGYRHAAKGRGAGRRTRADRGVRRREFADGEADCGDWRRLDFSRSAYSLGAAPRLSAGVALIGAAAGLVEASENAPAFTFEVLGAGAAEASSTMYAFSLRFL